MTQAVQWMLPEDSSLGNLTGSWLSDICSCTLHHSQGQHKTQGGRSTLAPGRRSCRLAFGTCATVPTARLYRFIRQPSGVICGKTTRLPYRSRAICGHVSRVAWRRFGVRASRDGRLGSVPPTWTVLNREPEVAKREISSPRTPCLERETSVSQCGLSRTYLARHQFFS